MERSEQGQVEIAESVRNERVPLLVPVGIGPLQLEGIHVKPLRGCVQARATVRVADLVHSFLVEVTGVSNVLRVAARPDRVRLP